MAIKGRYKVDDPLGDGLIEVVGSSDLYPGKVIPRRGKVRDVYDLGDELIIVTTDRISAFDVVYPTLIPHKGKSLHALAEYWLKKTMDIMPNHYIETIDSRTMRVRKADRIDVEWVCRAYLYGSAWRAYRNGARTVSGVKLPDGLVMAEKLPEVIITPTTKSDSGHDQEISKDEAIVQGLVTRDNWNELEEATYRLFDYFTSHATSRGFIIPDFKLEYGKIGDQLIMIDEPPTHDSARYWAQKFYKSGEPQENTCLDKEFLRECLRRMGYQGDGTPPVIPAPIVREVSKRCVASYQVVSGLKTPDDYDLATVDEVMREVKALSS